MNRRRYPSQGVVSTAFFEATRSAVPNPRIRDEIAFHAVELFFDFLKWETVITEP